MQAPDATLRNAPRIVANFQTKKTKNPMQCVLADGKEIKSKGIIEVEAETDDETHVIAFEDLPVECPILSVKKIVKKKERRRKRPQHCH